MSMSVSEFFRAYLRYQAVAQKIIPVEAKASLTAREYTRCFSSSTNGPTHDFWLSAITSDGLEYSSQYNDSCHCHAEMRTATLYILWSQIEAGLDEAAA